MTYFKKAKVWLVGRSEARMAFSFQNHLGGECQRLVTYK